MPADSMQQQASLETSDSTRLLKEVASSSGSMSPVLARETLQQALSRCMAMHPPEGLEYRMHPDANRMADLWAAMLVQRIDRVSIDAVDPRVLEAFQRWS